MSEAGSLARRVEVARDLMEALHVECGHFRYESAHHGDMWLDLDALFVDRARARRWCSALARTASGCAPEFVCGPRTGGAFVAESMASELGVEFACADRLVDARGSVSYALAPEQHARLRERSVLLVDDAVNAGSAWRATSAELDACGARIVGLACLLTLGETAARMADERAVPLFILTSVERRLWTADACPPCARGVPLVDRVRRSPQGDT